MPPPGCACSPRKPCTYDANGNMLSGGGLQYVHTSFNMPQAIGAATYSAGLSAVIQ